MRQAQIKRTIQMLPAMILIPLNVPSPTVQTPSRLVPRGRVKGTVEAVDRLMAALGLAEYRADGNLG